MTTLTLSEAAPLLKKEFREGRLIPFLGAGFSKPLKLPDGSQLIASLAKTLGFEPELFDMHGRFEQLAEFFALSGPTRFKELVYTMTRGFDSTEAEALKVLAERFRLEQVLVNLMQNALEALEITPDPRITVQVETRRNQARIVIADNGPGLTDEAARTLFTPFATTKPRGLGLGLVISRDIVAEVGGELSFEPGPGARFVISLPRAK